MRHLKKGKKLSRKTDQRRALRKSLVSAVVAKKRITTTLTKAKAAAVVLEKLITKAKRATLADRREVQKVLSPKLASRLFKEIAPLYQNRKGGCTRIIKTADRRSDGAKMAILELV